MYFSFQACFDAPFCLVSLIKVGYHYHKGILHLNRHLKNSLEKSIVIDDSIFCLNLFAGISTTNNMINKTGWVQYQDCCKLCRLALFGKIQQSPLDYFLLSCSFLYNVQDTPVPLSLHSSKLHSGNPVATCKWQPCFPALLSGDND